MPADGFPAAMEREKREITELFERITDLQFDTQEAVLPTGRNVPLGRALLEAPLQWITACRMQLFLCAKVSGNPDIGTANCWAGIDWPKK
jgi:hypothetical protein